MYSLSRLKLKGGKEFSGFQIFCRCQKPKKKRVSTFTCLHSVPRCFYIGFLKKEKRNSQKAYYYCHQQVVCVCPVVRTTPPPPPPSRLVCRSLYLKTLAHSSIALLQCLSYTYSNLYFYLWCWYVFRGGGKKREKGGLYT
jgi:hypothetical protein